MHAVRILVVLAILYGDVTFSWMPVPQEAVLLKSTTETKENATLATSPAPDIKCKTAKNLTGACVKRERCDYGPGSIDHSLYASRGYKKPCKTGEVCCPNQFIQVLKHPAERSVDNDYDDDDDDDF